MANENRKSTVTEQKLTAPTAAAEVQPAATPAVQPSPDPEEKVSVFIPRAGGGDDRMLYVAVNDYVALLPRGKTSLVPAFVAAEIERANEERERFYSGAARREVHA